MKLVSYIDQLTDTGAPSIQVGAALGDDCIANLHVAQTWAQGARGFRAREIPQTMLGMLRNWPDVYPHLRDLLAALEGEDCLHLKGSGRQPVARPAADMILLPPLPNVLSLRDFYGFEEHVRNVFRLRGKSIPHAWYQMPVFYYGNPFTVIGPDQALTVPDSGIALDYECEVAWVIGRQGRNIDPEHAEEYIAGYTIMNDWSLRDVQSEEMQAGLGPAKGKDFATTLGPALVTPDELEDRRIGSGTGLGYDLAMTARVNGVETSRGSLKDLHWTIAQMIARASQDVTIFPGEVMVTGTVGTGCLLEGGAQESGEWLKAGDLVELEVERLGRLSTPIIASQE